MQEVTNIIHIACMAGLCYMAYTATCPWGSTPWVHVSYMHSIIVCSMLIVCLQMTKMTMNVHLVSHLADCVQNWAHCGLIHALYLSQ